MGALREPRFRRLLVGWSLSNFGDSALYLSLAIWAKDLTGSNAAAGLVFFAWPYRCSCPRWAGMWPTGSAAAPC